MGMNKKIEKSKLPDGGVPGVAQTLRRMKNETGIPSDVLGSYTGMAEDDERPVQDQDDL